MWQPDGWGFRARLGILVPHAAIGTESELAAMAPDGVSIHAARVPLGVMRAGGLMDPTIASALVDRLMHHAHVVVTSGESIRLADATTGKGVKPLD